MDLKKQFRDYINKKSKQSTPKSSEYMGFSKANEKQAMDARDFQNEVLGQLLMDRIPHMDTAKSGQAQLEKVMMDVYPGLEKAANAVGVSSKLKSLPTAEYDKQYPDTAGGYNTKEGVVVREGTYSPAGQVGTMAHEIGHMNDRTAQAYQDQKFQKELEETNPSDFPGFDALSRLISSARQGQKDKAIGEYLKKKPAAAKYFKEEFNAGRPEELPYEGSAEQEEQFHKKTPLEMQRDMSEGHHSHRNFPEENVEKLLETGNILDVVQAEPELSKFARLKKAIS